MWYNYAFKIPKPLKYYSPKSTSFNCTVEIFLKNLRYTPPPPPPSLCKIIFSSDLEQIQEWPEIVKKNTEMRKSSMSDITPWENTPKDQPITQG